MSTTPAKSAATTSTSSVTSKASSAGKDETAVKLDKLDMRVKATNFNNVARIANSNLTSADDKLHAMHALKNNKPIERFPPTAKDIPKLTDTLVDAMLLALEAERTGTKEQKLERLREQIGLKANPA